jgi:hypothetical protein
MRAIFVSLALAAALGAQSLEIRSEFQRVDPFGQVVPADRMEHPREILSPAVARNAWASFHLVVEIPEGAPSFIYVQQNPEFFEIKVYRERYTRIGETWVPDRLEPVTIPASVALPDPNEPIPGQKTLSFWLDFRVPEKTPAGRMRTQAVLKAGEQWIVYPMEVRVMEATVPKVDWHPARVARITARADASLCAGNTGEEAPAETVRQMIRRNAVQDAALARSLGVPAGACEAPGPDAEWYLHVRDKLLQPMPGRQQ